MPLADQVLRQSRRAVRSASRRVINLRDRLFDSGSLVLAEQTPHQVIYEEDILRLRYYPPLTVDRIEVGETSLPVRKEKLPVPLILVAPLAVNMSIYDLFPNRSLVRYLRARGFELYLIDWGRPTRRHDRYRLETYIGELMPALVERVRAHSGCRRVSLHGWSFGGLFSYAHAAASRDPDIANLVLLGAPCDYHDNGAVGQQYRRLGRLLKRLGQNPRLRPHATAPRWWHTPGWANSLAYKFMTPVASLKPYVDLLRRLDDRQAVAEHATNAAFLNDMVAYPGGVIQDIAQYLWADNVLAQGRLPIAGSDAQLSDIHCNLLLVTGDRDPIVTRSCSERLLHFVQSTDCTRLEVPGGHMSIVSGSEAPRLIWPQIANWLETRSQE